MSRAPIDNLVRICQPAIELRAAASGDGNTMVGHFAVFNSWTEIASSFEGNFLERIAPGAFTDTFDTRGDQIRVLYDHGMDPSVGNKPLGTPTVLREDRTGAYYEVDLFDASYVNDLKPALRSGQLGASFRFAVTDDKWDMSPNPSDVNPRGLDQRTITGVKLYEFGPVTFPAYADATAGMRSGTDWVVERLMTDDGALRSFLKRVGPGVVNSIRAALPPSGDAADGTEPSATVPVVVPSGRNTVTINVPRTIGADVLEALERYQITTESTVVGGDVDEATTRRRQWMASRFHIFPKE
jgi:HK97 family phage prohead protease